MFVLYLGGGSAAHGNRVLLNDESDDAPVILVLSEVQSRKPLCRPLVKDYYSLSGQSGMVIERRGVTLGYASLTATTASAPSFSMLHQAPQAIARSWAR